jgi:hypothetical protein
VARIYQRRYWNVALLNEQLCESRDEWRMKVMWLAAVALNS